MGQWHKILGVFFYQRCLKGLVPEMDWNVHILRAWVHLGLKKGCGRFWNFSDVPIPEKIPYIFLFLEVNGKPTYRLTMLLACT